MDTSGTSREHLLMLVPASVLVFFTVFMLGGLGRTLDLLNRMLDSVWDVAWSVLTALL